MVKISSHKPPSINKPTKTEEAKKPEKNSGASSSPKPASSKQAGHIPTHQVTPEAQATARARVVHDPGTNQIQHKLNNQLNNQLNTNTVSHQNTGTPQPVQTTQAVDTPAPNTSPAGSPPADEPTPTPTPGATTPVTKQTETTPQATVAPEAAPIAPDATTAVSTPSAPGTLTPAQYPEAVNNVINVDEFLNNVQIPAEIQAQGTGAVNSHKIKELSAELHSQIYNDDGSYRKNPSPPFTDADAVQTIYSAAADLSKKQTLEENPRPSVGEWSQRTAEEWTQRPEFRDKWVENFVPLASTGVNGSNKKFGDYGWNPLYQDGTPGQSSHFQLAMNGTYMAGGIKPLAWAGNIQHEYQGEGPSVQDFLNSQLAVRMTSQLVSDNQYSPAQFAQDWGSNIRSGEPFASMNLSNPFNVPELIPILGLPQKEIDRSRYPE